MQQSYFKNNDCVSPGGPVESINGQLKLLNLGSVSDPVTEFFIYCNGLSATNEVSFKIQQEKTECPQSKTFVYLNNLQAEQICIRILLVRIAYFFILYTFEIYHTFYKI